VSVNERVEVGLITDLWTVQQQRQQECAAAPSCQRMRDLAAAQAVQ
jgi:hypothetical protein